MSFARQNARLVRDVEEYFREMYRAEVSSWNLRDIHMAETVEALVEHLSQDHRPAKIVVWEHNTRALEPLERTALWEQGEAPDTYPFGI